MWELLAHSKHVDMAVDDISLLENEDRERTSLHGDQMGSAGELA